MIDAGRLQRAIWLEVQPVAPGRYLVRGGADDHVVETDGGRVTCHCLDAQRAGDGEVIDALRQLVPNPRHFPAKRRKVPA